MSGQTENCLCQISHPHDDISLASKYSMPYTVKYAMCIRHASLSGYVVSWNSNSSVVHWYNKSVSR